MKVGILECGIGLEPHLLKYFEKNQHFAKIISDSELLEALPLSFLPPQNSIFDGEIRYDCYVLNIGSSLTVDKALEIILQKNSEGSLWRPRVILISNLASWSGKRYQVSVGASLSEFTSRVPSGKEILNYKLENKFHSCASITGMQMCLVSSGLLYGGSGFDFHNLFRALWESTPDKINYLFSTSNGKNIVPMIHFQDLVEIVGHLATCTTLSSFFFPAADGCSSNLSVIAEQLSLVSKRTVEVMKKEDAIDFLLNSEEGNLSASLCPPRVWNLDLRFSDSARVIEDVYLRYPNGMIDFVVDIWKEYVNACATEPCSFLIAGPPSSLKSSIANELANKLQIAYIDPVEAMKFIVDVKDSPDVIDRVSSTDVSHTLDLAQITEPSVALKIELGRVLTVQINGEKKKGKAVEDTPVDLKTVNWTPSLVAAIPSDLIRRCAKVMISEDVVCARAGYVLDLWGHIKDLENFYEVTGTLPNMEDPKTRQLISQQPSFCLDGFDTSPISKSSLSPRLNQTSTSPRILKANTQKLPQVIVELQSPDSVTIDRVLASLGCEQGGKLTKDQQAVIKDLESKMAQYSTKLVDHVSSKGTPFKTSSLLKMVQEIGYDVRYVDVSHLNGRGEGDSLERNKASISHLVNEIYEEYSSSYGPLPWLSSKEQSVSVQEEQQPKDEVELKLIDDDLLRSDARVPEEHPEERIIKPMTCDLDNLNDQLKQKVIENANNLQNYLVANVLPHVAEALVTISRERIEDPVLYLANFLYQRGVAVQEQETTAAYEKFLTAVQQAEAMEEEAAAQLLALSQQRCS